jgi:hypothetical protein
MYYSGIKRTIGNTCGIIGTHADNRQLDSCFPERAIDEFPVLFLEAKRFSILFYNRRNQQCSGKTCKSISNKISPAFVFNVITHFSSFENIEVMAL